MTAPAQAANRPTIPDAAGISSNGKSKTSSAVDALLSPTAATSAQSIVEIPVKYVVPHPRNRKILDDDVADLVASFKAGEPIINPLGVTAAADWNTKRPADLKDVGPLEYIITAGGHRRLRAAELAGLKTVPCIVRPDFAGAQGRKAALLENLHRQDLDAFEEAEAFAELTGEPYKLSQRALAGITGYNQSHISKRLKLLKLPSTVRAHVQAGKFTIADAVELSRLADDKPLLDDALKRVRDHYPVKRAVDMAIEENERETKRRAEVARLTEAGITIIDRAPSYNIGNGREPVRLDSLGIKTVSHKKEPCHAVHIRSGWNGVETAYCCTEPKRHIGAKAASTVKSKVTSTGGRQMSDREKAEKRLKVELKKNVEPARLAIVRQLLTSGFDTQTRRTLVTRSVIERLLHGGYSTSNSELAVDLLGIRPANKNAYLHDVLEAYAKTAKEDQLALVGAVVYFEGKLRDGNWRHFDDTDRWYLELLEHNGYVITDAEHEKLGDVQADGNWIPSTEPDPVDDPKCRTCFQYLDSLPAGVTKVADDLCSACSDAEDAGWVAPETAVAG